MSAGTRINWGGVIKQAAVDLWDTDTNTPDNAPTLWEDIAYRQGYRIIPATITAGTAFAQGECGERVHAGAVPGWMGGGAMSATQAGQHLKYGVTFIFGNSYKSDFIISPNIYSFLNNFNIVS